RQGHATAVLAALLQRARQEGASHATLDVASGNNSALALYSRFGFRTAGCRKGYYQDGRDALIQWLRLHPARPND
ncbi:MAG: GNAT family N-acetyltransferase, partial [Synechococcus sp.]